MFGVRSGDGPPGIPINKPRGRRSGLRSAARAAYRLDRGLRRSESAADRADLVASPQTTATLPIACVEGWSAIGSSTGVRVRALLALVGAPAESMSTWMSLQASGPYRVTVLPRHFASDDLTLLGARSATGRRWHSTTAPRSGDRAQSARCTPDQVGLAAVGLDVRGRWVSVGVLGVAGGFGAWPLLSRQDLDLARPAAIWLVVGVVLHDASSHPTLLLAAVGRECDSCPRRCACPAMVGFVVLATVTLLAVPVLGRFGARPDNPTLLDRNYVGGWLVLAGCRLAVRSRASSLVRISEQEVSVARVLVVEDDPTVREVVVSYLRAAGHEVVEAARRGDRAALPRATRRPGRPRPDAARHRRPRGLPPAARARPTCPSSC